jgi:hypothetical protein
MTGFGVSPITVPVLAHFLPLAFVLPLAATLDLGSAVALSVHTKKQGRLKPALAAPERERSGRRRPVASLSQSRILVEFRDARGNSSLPVRMYRNSDIPNRRDAR